MEAVYKVVVGLQSDLRAAAFLSFVLHVAVILLIWRFVPLPREFEPFEPTPIPVEIVVALADVPFSTRHIRYFA